MKAEKAEFGMLLIIREDERYYDAIQIVYDRKEQLEEEVGENVPAIIVVDVTRNTSVSKA